MQAFLNLLQLLIKAPQIGFGLLYCILRRRRFGKVLLAFGQKFRAAFCGSLFALLQSNECVGFCGQRRFAF